MDLISKTKEDIDTIYLIGQCCILKNQYSSCFRNSIFYYDQFGTDVLTEFKKYLKSEYTWMNYQKSIQPALNLTAFQKLLKIDIDSAY